MSINKQYTILVVGDKGVGKSTYIKRLSTGIFLTEHKSTEELVTTECKFYTTGGIITINLVEVPYNYKIADLKADGVIVLFDMGRAMYATDWLAKLDKNMSLVYCCTKADNMVHKSRGWYLMMSTFIKKCQDERPNGFVFYDLSAKSNYNLEKPTLYLMRQLSEQPTLLYQSATT